MVGYSHRASYVSVTMGAAYTAASKGDVYLYDWGKGNGCSHASMETKWGDYINYYDPVIERNYNSVTGGEGDKMAQHTTDRDGAPRNWGYHIEYDPTVKAKMRTVIMDVTH